MLKFSFGKEKDFRHIAPGLIPAASIAPKAAVPRTPPPRSPSPSPERPRSALAAAILSSSLTGQTWAIPFARPRSFSDSDCAESIMSPPITSTALYNRDRWSENLVSEPNLSSPGCSEEEMEDEEEVEDEEYREEHVYQTLDRKENCSVTEPVYAVPLKPKDSATQQTQRSGGRVLSPGTDFSRTEEVMNKGSNVQLLEASCDTSKKSFKKSPRCQKEEVLMRSPLPIPTTDRNSQRSETKNPKQPTSLSPEPSRMSVSMQLQTEKSTSMVDNQTFVQERPQLQDQEISLFKASSNMRSPTGSQVELHNLRRHAQQLVDENDALKLTVHRLNVELSCYQSRFRPLSKQESFKIRSLPKTGSPPPWLIDMKHLSPLLLAYEDRMNEKDALVQITEMEVKKLRVQLEKVIKENEQLHDENAKIGGVSPQDCQRLQQQARLVLQENQVLIDQLEAHHVKAKASQGRQHSEVSKVSRQLMLLETEKQRLQEDLEESRMELQKNVKEVQVLQARLKDSVTWDEHCKVAGKLRWQLEQQQSKSKSEMEDFLLRMSSLQEENRSLGMNKAFLHANIKKMETELELTKEASRKAERRMSVMKRQKQDCLVKEEKTWEYMEAVISVAEQVSKERDQLVQMASVLQQEKQRFLRRILKSTAQFRKLHEDVKVYRSKASSRLAVMEETAEGKTATFQREILHLQRLLRERQEAEERLLQSKREIEDELEVLWQAATRENQQIRKTLIDSKLTTNINSWALSTT